MKSTIRNLLPSDIPALIPVLLETWDYDNHSTLENRKKATELFLLHDLSISDYRKVLIIDDEVCGILCGKKDRDFLDPDFSSLYSSLSKEYRKNPDIDQLSNYNDVVNHADEELVQRYQKPYYEVTLLILGSSTKGKGCGRRLLENFSDEREENLSIILTSDKDCNYHFYEHMGYKIIDQHAFDYEMFQQKKKMESFLFCHDSSLS